MKQDIDRFITDGIDYARSAWCELGGKEQYYCFGPISLRVRHVGNTLINTIAPAIQHAISSERDHVNGTVYVLDARSLCLQEPPSEWPFATDTHQGQQRIHWDIESGLALNSDESRGVWQLFDLKSGNGLYWVKDEQTLPSWEAGSPLRIFLHWLTWMKDCQLIHAAGLERNGCGVLLTGRGGSGKSTTTAAAVNAEWNTVGDDFVLFADEREPIAYCIYDNIKLTEQSLENMPKMAAQVTGPPVECNDKAMIHLGEYYKQQLKSDIPIAVLCMLNIVNTRQTIITPASKAAIMTALAPTTMFMLKMGMSESFEKMTRLVNSVRCYSIQMSSDPEEVVESLANFIDNSIEPN